MRIQNIYNKKSTVFVLIFIAALSILLCYGLIKNSNRTNGQILYNGLVYKQVNSAIDNLPYHCTEIGRLQNIIDEKADLKNDFDGKNINSEYKNMPIFIQKENPDTIFLTCGGKGWMPFKSYSMDEKHTKSWIKPIYKDRKLNFSVRFDKDIKWYGICADIYENSQLISSDVILYNTITENNYANEKEFSASLYLNLLTPYYNLSSQVDNNNYDMLNLVFSRDNVESSLVVSNLPAKNYTGWAISPMFGNNKSKFKLTANDSFNLLSIVLPTDINSSVYTDIWKNENIVVFKLITSSVPFSNDVL